MVTIASTTIGTRRRHTRLTEPASTNAYASASAGRSPGRGSPDVMATSTTDEHGNDRGDDEIDQHPRVPRPTTGVHHR